MHITALYVRDIRINHEGDEVENEISTLSKDAERGKAKIREACIVLRVHTAHAINHLFANLDGRRIQLRIMPKYVAKVDVEEMAWWGTLFDQRELTRGQLVRTIWRNK